MDRYVTLHGHFYQPPRENPWLEATQREESAYPYHDWNERISAECYAPNALARVLDDRENIVRIVNNYARISFNFGPTLSSWMEKHDPSVYAAILEADRASAARFSGHGSAIAQAYGHLILPLASPRDQATQVRWGIADFRHRFGRVPEGMWLPETAADTSSLEALAREGIRFTILAPRQARSIRAIGAKTWTELEPGSVDPSMPYRVPLPSGASIVVFFYDGPISQRIAFEGLLHRGEHLADALVRGFHTSRARPELVHVATDGETYGHHHRHGEMALARCLSIFDETGVAKLTNYGEFLERFPPTHEARIHEGSSWSCAHGIERWRSDCGCHAGGGRGWNQAWRGPLRSAMDTLRDAIAGPFESIGARWFRSPWEARDAYVRVLLDRSRENVDAFFAEQAARPLSREERVSALELMELSRQAMQMYTSCGWFFDDVSGIEATQVLAYAGRAAELATKLFGDRDLLPSFLSRLELAKSNVLEARDARKVFEERVRPARVDLPRVAAHYAMTSLFTDYAETARVHAFEVHRETESRFEAGTTRALLGRAKLRSTTTEETQELTYAALFVGDHNLHAGVRELRSPTEHDTIRQELSQAFDAADLPEAIRVLDRHFGQLPFTTRDLFRDEKRAITRQMLEPTVREVEEIHRRLYERHAPLMRFVVSLGVALPRALRMTSELSLHSEMRAALAEAELDPKRVKMLLDEAREAKIALDEASLSFALGGRLQALASELEASPTSLVTLARLAAAVDVARALPFSLSLWPSQNAFARVQGRVLSDMRRAADAGDGDAKAWLAAFEALGERLRVKIG